MDGLNIVAGDLEFLAKSDETLGDDLKKVDIKGPMEDAKEGMPGSESAKIIPEVTKEITQRYATLSLHYRCQRGLFTAASNWAPTRRFAASGTPMNKPQRSNSGCIRFSTKQDCDHQFL